MIYAEKGNRVKQIREDEVDKYANQGYMIKDGTGTVIKETVPTDLNTLRLAYVQHLDEIKSLKAEISNLKEELSKAKKATPKKEVSEDAEPKPRKAKAEKSE